MTSDQQRPHMGPSFVNDEDEIQVERRFRRVCGRILHQVPWRTAVKVQVLVLRNAAGSILCAWIPSACCALGNVFSGKWYTEQSRNEFMVAISVWGSITFCGVVFTAVLVAMLSFQFVSDRSPIWFCLNKLVRATSVYFAATVGFMFAANCFVAYLISVEPAIFTYRLDCYFDTVALIGYIAGTARVAHQMYHEDTQQGRARLQQKQQRPQRTKVAPEVAVSGLPVRRLSFKNVPIFLPLTFWRAYLKILPVASSPILACVSVHVLSQLRVLDSNRTVIASFVAISLDFKLAIQELAKLFIFKKRVRSARVMCVLVGIPTVLIDTQTRIILLGSSTTTAAAGAIGMALVEITVRTVKAALLMLEIRHRRALLVRTNASVLQQQAMADLGEVSTDVVPKSQSRSRSSVSSRLNQFEMWHRQVHTFHMAELNADMYAEYISIGCSASILFFYGNHPHYAMLRQSADSDATSIDSVKWRINQLSMLTLQIGIEVVVDFVSIVIEVTIGIEFAYAKKLGSFLAGVFMVAAVMNSTISIGFYLS